MKRTTINNQSYSSVYLRPVARGRFTRQSAFRLGEQVLGHTDILCVLICFRTDEKPEQEPEVWWELTIFLVTVLVRVHVAILVAVCLGESRDVRGSFGFSWRLVQKLLQLLLIQLPSGGWMETKKGQQRVNDDKVYLNPFIIFE